MRAPPAEPGSRGRTAAADGAVFGPGAAARVLAMTTGRRPRPREDDLTDRERDVLEMIAQGASNVQIAKALGLSLKTVQNYVSRYWTSCTSPTVRRRPCAPGRPALIDRDARP